MPRQDPRLPQRRCQQLGNGYTAPNGGTVRDPELKGVLEGSGRGLLDVMSRYLPAKTDKNHNKSKSGEPVTLPGSEPNTFHIRK
jgi:hypothetical protein